MENENDCFSSEKVHTTNFSAPTQGILINKSFLEGKFTVLLGFSSRSQCHLRRRSLSSGWPVGKSEGHFLNQLLRMLLQAMSSLRRQYQVVKENRLNKLQEAMKSKFFHGLCSDPCLQVSIQLGFRLYLTSVMDCD